MVRTVGAAEAAEAAELAEMRSPKGGALYVLRSATASRADCIASALYAQTLRRLGASDLLLISAADGSVMVSVITAGERFHLEVMAGGEAYEAEVPA